MSPREKLPKSKPEGKRKLDCPECPYCNFHRCWKHGKRMRKGTHRTSGEPTNSIIEIERYLCRHPSCEHTFSILPEDVVPYCRFALTGLSSILKDLAQDESVDWIAHHRWGTTERVIFRALDRIEIVEKWFEQLFREKTGIVKKGFHNLVRLLSKKFTWSRLSRMWFHHFYPLRVAHILNPHNLQL